MHALERTFSEITQEFDELVSSEGAHAEASQDETGEYSLLSEADEMELAAELLSVTSEAELDQFLGKLIKGVGKFVKSPVGKALGGIFKAVAKTALPIVGNLVAPGIGGIIGQGIASSLKGKRKPPGAPQQDDRRPRHDDRGAHDDARASARASEIFGLETEGLTLEDEQFEVARHFVRFAIAATQELNAVAPGASPRAAAVEAATSAAREHAPGLLEELVNEAQQPRMDRGHWIRQGHSIVLIGV